jgi:hypothetical protein
VAGALPQSDVPGNVVLRDLQREAKALRERPEFAAHLKD